jgi:hypothetical protein
MSSVRYDLPRPAWRALHSAFIDVVGAAPLEVGQAFVTRVGGSLDFAHFMLAIHSGRSLTVRTRITDEGRVNIGVAVPVSDGADWQLFTLDQDDHGVTAEWVLTAANFRIDEELHALLDGGT